MNPLVVIPTFVSSGSRKRGASPLATYDHATPLNQQGELPRCLNSLLRVRGIGAIALLVVSEPSVEDRAAEKIHAICNQFPALNTVVIGTPELALVRQRMDQMNAGDLNTEIGLTGYGATRNLGLLLANALGFDSIVFLDDDEVIDRKSVV